MTTKIWSRRTSAWPLRPAASSKGADPARQEKTITGQGIKPPLGWPQSRPHPEKLTSQPKSSVIAESSAPGKATTVCHRKVNRARAIFKRQVNPLARTSYTATKHILTRVTKTTYRFVKNDVTRIRRGDLHYRGMAIAAAVLGPSAFFYAIYRAPPAKRAAFLHKLLSEAHGMRQRADALRFGFVQGISARVETVKSWPSRWDAAMKDWFFTWQGIDEKDRWRYLQ
jgi:hypothetical protein